MGYYLEDPEGTTKEKRRISMRQARLAMLNRYLGMDINSPPYWDFICSMLREASASLSKFAEVTEQEFGKLEKFHGEGVSLENCKELRRTHGDPEKHRFHAKKLLEIIDALQSRPDYAPYPDEE